MLADDTPATGAVPEWPTDGMFESIEVRAAAVAFERGEPAGSGTHVAAGAEALVVPIRTGAHRFGIAAVRPEPVERPVEVEEWHIVEALAGHLAAELERTAWAQPSKR